ncbi:MAG TPA: hypothetical protein VJH95_02395 [Candidatus Nanoarchaeia archaeon]|nr:hypothetical protein [Candidatus Nanoarchaeia archaeon]
MVKIKKIGVLSSGKLCGVLYALIGLIAGAFISLFAIILSMFSSDTSEMFGPLFGVGAIIFLPILYGTLGFVSGLLTALLYNLVASWVGGLEIEISK